MTETGNQKPDPLKDPHGMSKRKREVLEQINTQPEHRETRREMYEGLHRIPSRRKR